MRRLRNIPQLHLTMLALYIVAQLVDFVNCTNADPDEVPDGHACLIQGEGRASGLEFWDSTGFLEGKHHPKLLAAFLIALFFLLSALIVTMRWRCWKTGDPGLGQQKEMADQYPDFESNSATVGGPSNWTVSIPYPATNRSDDFKVPIPTLSNESPARSPINQLPSNLTIGVYTGFTTGVGPRR